MSWTEERVELLKKLWADGLSASQIAAELGGDHPQRGDRQSPSSRPVGPRQKPLLILAKAAQGAFVRHDAGVAAFDARQYCARLRL